MTIKKAIQEIVDEIRNVRDLRSVPDAPPENNDVFPFAVVYPVSGTFEKQSWGWSVDLHNVAIELHVARKDLPRDFMQIVDVFDSIPNQLESGLQNDRFSTVDTWGNITYIFGALEWAGVETLGVTFTMESVKLIGTVT